MMSLGSLLITFDALGTLYRPTKPIAVQYANVAANLGFPRVKVSELDKSFKIALKQTQTKYPNYGKEQGMDSKRWWLKVIEGTFGPFATEAHPITPRLQFELMKLFSTNKGYTLYEDAAELLATIATATAKSNRWPWHSTVVGVVSNSDDRVPRVLRSLGLSVGKTRWKHSPVIDRKLYAMNPPNIDFTVLSWDAGVEKPDPIIFRRAAQTAEQLPYVADLSKFVRLHVGDSVEKDVPASLNAGWKSILIDRERKFAAEMRNSGTRFLPVAQPQTAASLPGHTHFEVVQDLRQLTRWKP